MPDLDARARLLPDTFGCAAVHEEVNEDQGVREAMLAVGDPAPHATARAAAARTPPRALPGPRGPGVQQLAYTVTTSTVAGEAARRGVRVLYDEPRRGTAGSLVNFVHPKDAGGVLVELVQPVEQAHPLPR